MIAISRRQPRDHAANLSFESINERPLERKNNPVRSFRSPGNRARVVARLATNDPSSNDYFSKAGREGQREERSLDPLNYRAP